jgi:amidophosphoribosyltransferase
MFEHHSPATLIEELDGDTLHEECGVFGILGHSDAAALTALGLHALQHRGQEAAGIVSFDGRRFHQERHMGLVGDHYTNPMTLARLPGSMAIGHTRYSTTGEVAMRNVQPLFAELEEGGVALAHNGNFTNGLTLRRQIIATGAICQSTSDTEVVLHLISRSRHASTTDRFIDAIRQMEGGYSILCMSRTKLIAARDPIGIRPLVMGELDGKPIFCSETCALDIIGAKYIRDVEIGEVIICEIQPDGSISIDARKPNKPQPERLCLFEYVYFARPDSVVGGRNVYTTRKNMGINLATESPVEADVVVPVPDGGTPAAIGYAQASGIPFELGIIRNHYVGRTFIEPTQQIRAFGVKLKHSANRAMIEGKHQTQISCWQTNMPTMTPWRNSSALIRLPSYRSMVFTALLAAKIAMMRAHSSPTTISPVTIQLRFSIRMAKPWARRFRCWPRTANQRSERDRVYLRAGFFQRKYSGGI